MTLEAVRSTYLYLGLPFGDGMWGGLDKNMVLYMYVFTILLIHLIIVWKHEDHWLSDILKYLSSIVRHFVCFIYRVDLDYG